MYCVLRRKTDAMLGSGVLSVTPESRSLQMKGGRRGWTLASRTLGFQANFLIRPVESQRLLGWSPLNTLDPK